MFCGWNPPFWWTGLPAPDETDTCRPWVILDHLTLTYENHQLSGVFCCFPRIKATTYCLSPEASDTIIWTIFSFHLALASTSIIALTDGLSFVFFLMLLQLSGPVELGKTLESPLDCKDIQPVHPKGDQSWMFIGRTDAEAETSILWPPDAKNWLTWKDPDAGKDWGQEEKGMTEDEMVGWHQWLNGHEFGWTPGVGDGQGGLACCSPWGHKESDMTEQLNWTGPRLIIPQN